MENGKSGWSRRGLGRSVGETRGDPGGFGEVWEENFTGRCGEIRGRSGEIRGRPGEIRRGHLHGGAAHHHLERELGIEAAHVGRARLAKVRGEGGVEGEGEGEGEGEVEGQGQGEG